MEPTPNASRGLIARYAIAWAGMVPLAILNGVAREKLYSQRLGPLRAHQLSTLTGIELFGAYTWLVHRRWPIPTARLAAAVGAMWLAMTVVFEFGFGRRVAGKSWGELLADYDLRRRRTWPLVLAWIAVAPAATRARQRR